MAKQKKTNAMRQLDRAKVNYEIRTFEVGEGHLEGHEVAALINANSAEVYKTLVLENANHEHFVFVIPVTAHLDMKAAAAAVHEKEIALDAARRFEKSDRLYTWRLLTDWNEDPFSDSH